MELSKLNKKIFKVFIIGMVLISAVLIVIDIKGFAKAVREFKLIYMPIILVLVVLNFVFRFIKWEYYLKQMNIKIPKRESLKIFLSSMPMTITPGKVGELLKSYFLKVKFNYPVSMTLPIIIMERVADAIGILIIGGIGSLFFKYGITLLLFILFLIIIGIIIIQSRKLCYGIIKIIAAIPFLKKHASSITNFYESVCGLLKTKIIITAVVIGMFAWACEVFIIYYIIRGVDIDISVVYAMLIFALPSIVGTISMLPGGVVATEGSILAMLLQQGIEKGDAIFIILFIRLVTLWLGVLVGSVVLLKVERELFKEGIEDIDIIDSDEYKIIDNQMLSRGSNDKTE